MPKKIEEQIHVLCPTRAYLYPVSLMGPIVHPLQVKKSTAVQLLMTGAEVYEFIPATKKTIKLTLDNINNPARYEDPETPTKAAEPVTPVEKSGVPTPPPPPVNNPEPEKVEEPPVEEVIEEVATPVEGEAPAADPIAEYPFILKEDGTVDETNIVWTSMTKDQRKALRAKITEINAAAKANA